MISNETNTMTDLQQVLKCSQWSLDDSRDDLEARLNNIRDTVTFLIQDLQEEP